jgi:type II secretory pathway pseudopilin PulG
MVPAICTKCGQAYAFGEVLGGGSIVIDGDVSGTCSIPTCRGQTIVPRGLYREAQGLLEVIQRDAWGHERIQRFRAIVVAASKQKISVAEAAEQVRALDPTGQFSEIMARHGYPILAIMIAIILWLLTTIQTQANAERSNEETKRMFDMLLAQMQTGQLQQEKLLQQIDGSVADLRDALAALRPSNIAAPDSRQPKTKLSNRGENLLAKPRTRKSLEKPPSGGLNRKARRKAAALEKKTVKGPIP